MKTKPIDYTGCHPVIKDQLEQGRSVLCRLFLDSSEMREGNWIPGFVIGYDFVSNQSFYFVHDDSDPYMYAEPIETKRVLKDPVSLLKVMIEHGAIFDNTQMLWKMPDQGRWIKLKDFSKCGKEWSGTTLPDYFYEEIEV